MGSLFLLITLLPALLAIKYRGNKFEITMAGTLISVVVVWSFIIGTTIQSIATMLVETLAGDKFYAEDWSVSTYQREIFCLLLVCSNIPYLEWAHMEWEEIWKMRRRKVRR